MLCLLLLKGTIKSFCSERVKKSILYSTDTNNILSVEKYTT